MKLRKVEHLTAFGLAAVSGFVLPACKTQITKELPNILWIVSEDNSAYFTGCYGNSFATTPNIDKLAGEGFLYTHAYCSNAVSAPSRNTIITGVHAASNGNENMRSTYAKSSIVRTYPEFLREAGYYCTNNSKTDYNTNSIDPAAIWDESSNKAHYKNRPEGKPFFAVFNINTSHESCIHKQIPTEKLRHDPEKVVLPPYHPDTPEMRHDWAQYYDKIEDMDGEVGALLKELEESGEAENTIVMYYGDNGGILARSKRFVYETGTQIPFVIRIPEKYKYLFPGKPGQKVDRLINFVDLTPTLLSIIGTAIPEYMQGNAFLGKQKTEDPEYTYMSRQRMDEHYDLVRAVRDKQFRYIRNYMPFRITMQHVNYLFIAPSAQSWENAFKEGKTNEIQSRYFQPKPVEELYDSEKDPWEINNLVGDPDFKEVLERIRKAETEWMSKIKDVGLIPETEYGNFAGNGAMYDYMRSQACPLDALIEASDIATLGGREKINTLTEYLKDSNSAIRYWGATGLLILKDDARPAIGALREATKDNSGAVAVLAAEALYGLGEKELAKKTYINILKDTLTYDFNDQNFALNSIDALNEDSPELKTAIKQLYKNLGATKAGLASYTYRSVQWLYEKWNMEL
ncbi:MAG TPA: sulfatase [Bacteroidales bacterium]|nr:sulfatase [Bacteroidales bacterium]